MSKPQMNTDGHRWIGHGRPYLSVFIGVHLWLLLLSGCGTSPTDLRTLAPADSLVYLETNDLAAAIEPIVDSDAFGKAAVRKPDLSALSGVQVAVAITGFETTEQKVTDESSVGNIKPHFVAIADSHAWGFQAAGFTEQKLGAFVADIYDSQPTLDKSDKYGGTFYTWTAKDGRNAYALVIGSQVYFGNDASAIDKCIAVRQGQADSMLKVDAMPAMSSDTLASGYVSPDGIAQIAGVAGVKLATESAEESPVRSSIAAIVPQLIRGWVKEVHWTMKKTPDGIEDRWRITMPPDVASVFSETMSPGQDVQVPALMFAPNDAVSVTQYNVKDPQIAWRGLVLSAQRTVDPAFQAVIGQFANLFFEPYGYKDGEMFLSAVRPGVVTIKGDGEDATAVIAQLKDKQKAAAAMDEEFRKQAGAVVDAAGPGFDDLEITGDPEAVASCVKAQQAGKVMSNDARFGDPGGSLPSVRTLSRDKDSPALLAEFLSEKKAGGSAAEQSFSETRFDRTGVERRTVSDFGFIGWIMTALAGE